MRGAALRRAHRAQCLHYVRASGRTVCLLVNFQNPKVEWKRIVHGFPISEQLETPAVAGQVPHYLSIHFLDTTLGLGRTWQKDIARRHGMEYIQWSTG